MKSAFTRLE